jgi:hypothetical protein
MATSHLIINSFMLYERPDRFSKPVRSYLDIATRFTKLNPYSFYKIKKPNEKSLGFLRH